MLSRSRASAPLDRDMVYIYTFELQEEFWQRNKDSGQRENCSWSRKRERERSLRFYPVGGDLVRYYYTVPCSEPKVPALISPSPTASWPLGSDKTNALLETSSSGETLGRHAGTLPARSLGPAPLFSGLSSKSSLRTSRFRMHDINSPTLCVLQCLGIDGWLRMNMGGMVRTFTVLSWMTPSTSE